MKKNNIALLLVTSLLSLSSLVGCNNDKKSSSVISTAPSSSESSGSSKITEFPATEFGEYIHEHFDSWIVPQAFVADYYDMSTPGVIYCYKDVNNAEDSYKAAVKNDSCFELLEEKNKDGYYVANEFNGNYQLQFKYDAEAKALVIKVVAIPGWNKAKIARFFGTYQQPEQVIPALNIEDAKYTFSLDEKNDEYVVQNKWASIFAYYKIEKSGLTSQEIANYAPIARENGYCVDNTLDRGTTLKAYKMIGTGLYELILSYANNALTFKIAAGGNPDTTRELEWPASKIAALLPHAKSDTIPAYQGTNAGFEVVENEFNSIINVYLDAELVKTAVEKYSKILTDNGYEEKKMLESQRAFANDGKEFSSPDREFTVSVYTEGNILKIQPLMHLS